MTDAPSWPRRRPHQAVATPPATSTTEMPSNGPLDATVLAPFGVVGRYRPDRVTGEGACPFNSLYWSFLDRHERRFAGNPRMALAMKNWQRKPADQRRDILDWAAREQRRLLGQVV